MMQSEYARKCDTAIAEMDAAGVWRANGLPPYWQLGRKLGFEPCPPYYLPFRKVMGFSGLYFGFAWGTMMHLMLWRHQAMPIVIQVIATVFSGLFAGLLMASWYKYVRKKHRFSLWQDL